MAAFDTIGEAVINELLVARSLKPTCVAINRKSLFNAIICGAKVIGLVD